MSITVTGRKINVSDSLREYAEEKIDRACKVIDMSPLDITVELSREKNPSNPLPACCEVTVQSHGHIVRVEEHEEDLHTAIDVASAKVERQLRKFKTRVVNNKVRTSKQYAAAEEAAFAASEELDLDALMDELSEADIVREKELVLTPLTRDEALIQMDLLGHDFFAYIDRDSNLVNILYRRDAGGYGLLKQVEEA